MPCGGFSAAEAYDHVQHKVTETNMADSLHWRLIPYAFLPDENRFRHTDIFSALRSKASR